MSTWRDAVFQYRGTLLALPAVALVTLGRPSLGSALAGLPLALAGEALRCWAVGFSGVTTRSDRVVAPALTTAGPYAYVRNPLYVGNFVTALGFTLGFTGAMPIRSRAGFAAAGLGTMLAVYAVIVPLEEAYLRETFGDTFVEYQKRVPRLIPRGSAAEPQQGRYDVGVIAKAETRTFATLGVMVAALLWKVARASR